MSFPPRSAPRRAVTAPLTETATADSTEASDVDATEQDTDQLKTGQSRQEDDDVDNWFDPRADAPGTVLGLNNLSEILFEQHSLELCRVLNHDETHLTYAQGVSKRQRDGTSMSTKEIQAIVSARLSMHDSTIREPPIPIQVRGAAASDSPTLQALDPRSLSSSTNAKTTNPEDRRFARVRSLGNLRGRHAQSSVHNPTGTVGSAVSADSASSAGTSDMAGLDTGKKDTSRPRSLRSRISLKRLRARSTTRS
ncbi:hypothetical protein M231_06212 [Tremella mesenterica]|uniref:Uncharacterized protein n=1 Tax=Tremella mesenterica TaxID=5217 RepID=A0A4Q1BGC9_TREME|nr:hypothetical protein M231_06212 [Tremella mesenterica]